MTDFTVMRGLQAFAKKGEHEAFNELMPGVCMKCGQTTLNRAPVCPGPDLNDPSSYLRRYAAGTALPTVTPAGSA